MRLQLIFVVECDQKSKTDWIYIKETLDTFYSYDNYSVKLSEIYLSGKGNYNKKDTEIKKLISKFESTSSGDRRTAVIFCFDTDAYNNNPDAIKFISKAEEYCKERDYRFVWFCRDIEEVYYGYKVLKDEKVKVANRFKIDKKIENVNSKNLMGRSFKFKTSNIMTVLDDYLDRK